MVTHLYNATGDKRQRNTFQRLEDSPEYSSKSSSWKIQKNSVNNKLEIMTQNSEIIEHSNLYQFQVTEPENIVILPSTSLHNAKVSTTNFSLDKNHITL